MENFEEDYRESEINFMLNKKITKRVNTLLENKSNTFKRKYFLLAYLANSSIKDNKKLMSEVDCYVTSLINTNGSLPKEEFIQNLIKESLKYTKVKNYKALTKKAVELNNMINPDKSTQVDNIIFEELDKTLNINSFKIDSKLKEVLLESIDRKQPIFVNEAYGDKDSKVIDASSLLDDFVDNKKVEIPQTNKKEEYISDQEIDIQEPATSTKDFKSQQKGLMLKYDWLLKKSKIPFIRSKLKFYLPVGSDADYIGPNLEKIPDIDKLAIISRYKLIVEENATNAAMRKWEIIHQIYFYLNIQQRFMDSEIVSIGNRDLKKDKKRFTSSPSGLSEDEKNTIKNELNNLRGKINTSNMSSLNSNEITEAELLKLLRASAGSQKDVVEDFVNYLDSKYPDSKTSISQEILSDDEFEDHILGDGSGLSEEEFEEKMRKEDEEELLNSDIDPETGEPRFVSAQQAQNISKGYKDAGDDVEVVDLTSKEALSIVKQNILDIKIIDKLTKASNQTILSPAAQKALDDAQKRISKSKSIKINVLPDKTKGEIHLELLDAMDHMGGINTIDAETGRITSKEWEKFIEENIDVDGPMSSADIAKASQGAYKNTGGIRQDLTKQWFKSMFYSTNLDMKSEIYAELGKKYIDAIRGMDLVEDAIVNLQGVKKATEGEKSNFTKMEALITNGKLLKDYFTGNLDEDEDYEMIDELIGGLTSFRVFATWFLKDYYANNVWNKAEADLAYAVKQYFENKYPTSRIGENLKPGRQSKHVKPEFGKSIFNKIIFWTMGRTGIKDKGNVLPNPSIELEQRKSYFVKNMPKAIDEFNRGPQQNKINNFDVNHLMYDCLNDTTKVVKPIIGAAWDANSRMSSQDYSNFIEYIKKKNSRDFELKFIESALMNEYYESVLNNPLTPLGNPTEIEAIRKGKGSDSDAHKGSGESFKGAPYWFELWKDKTKDASKELMSHKTKKSSEREQAILVTKDYSFLEDDNLDLNGWQVLYKGKPVEVKDSVDIDSGKLEIIIDVFNSDGDVIDGEEKEVSINDVLSLK